MVKRHFFRLNAPKSWPLKRKGIRFVTRPTPGAHLLRESLPLALVVTDLLKYARTRKEVKMILYNGKILVNNRARKDLGFAVGIMDVIDVPVLKETYRVYYNQKGKFQLAPVSAEEKNLLPVKIVNKTVVKGGKIQVNTGNGTNLLLDKNQYTPGDTLVLSLDDKKVVHHFALEKGARIYIIGGTKRGVVGELQEIKGKNVVVKAGENTFETAKAYAFVIGDLHLPEAQDGI